MNGLRIERIRWSEKSSQISSLLDRAFAVKNYTTNFPHIFSDHSAAQIFAAYSDRAQMVGLCAVDTEIWTTPVFLRGACIGSVGVDPDCQRQGIGRQLMSAVVNELVSQRYHDFIYLFSDQIQFYSSVGFAPAGEEILDRVKRLKPARGAVQKPFRPPILTSQLTMSERARLWSALEVGRCSTESIASFVKTQQVLNIPEMLVSWIGEGDEIHAGAFVGKGIDFQGVVHSFFARDPNSLKDYWLQFLSHIGVHAKDLLVAAGGWRSCLAEGLLESRRQSLCLVHEWIPRVPTVRALFEAHEVYPRALLSS